MVSLAQGQAAALANCAWKDVAPYAPKGNNKSGVLGDINDTTVVYTNPSDGYWNGRLEVGKNGSGVPFEKTTHNGCPNGVADVNGNQFEILAGLTSIVSTKSITAITIAAEAVFTATAHGLTTGQKLILTGIATPAEWSTQLSNKMYTVEKIDNDTFKLKNGSAYINTSARSVGYIVGITLVTGTFYMYKDSVINKSVTASQHFNSTWILANCDVISPNFADGSLYQYYGNGTNQVLSGNTDRTSNDYKLTACGLPMASGFSTSGSSNFGNDYYYQYFLNSLCAIGTGSWYNDANAGVWFRILYINSGGSSQNVSARLSLSIV